MQMHVDKRKANCVQCVGGRNVQTFPDVRHLFKDFRDALYVYSLDQVRAKNALKFVVPECVL